jgi:hypothetical protein
MFSVMEILRSKYAWISPLSMLLLVVNTWYIDCGRPLHGRKQSPCAWIDRFSAIILGYGFQHSSSDHSVFVPHSSTNTIFLIVYEDDTIIFRSVSTSIVDLKRYLGQQFHTKDFGALCYFLGIEVVHSSQGSLCQRKYVLDLLRLVSWVLDLLILLWTPLLNLIASKVLCLLTLADNTSREVTLSYYDSL